jgi:hypothetical protein
MSALWWWIAFLVWAVASWGTHLYTCFVHGSWGFLIAGAIMFPIAWVHGTGVWFGWW